MALLKNVATFNTAASKATATLTGTVQSATSLLGSAQRSATTIKNSAVNGLTNVGTGVISALPGVAVGVGSAAAAVGAIGALTGSSGLANAAGKLAGAAAGIAAGIAAVGAVANALGAVSSAFGGAGAALGGGSSASSIKSNPLHAFASYNYLFGLYALSDGEANGGLRNGAGIPIVLEGEPNTPTIGATTFIDDVNLTGNMGLSQQAGNSNVHKITFKIVEPYSMGKFWESLQLAAKEAGHENYLQAPYMLSIKFKGHFGADEPFQTIPKTDKYIHMKIMKVDMRVSKKGTEYTVEAYPWNEAGMSNSFAEIKTDSNISCDKNGPKTVKALLKDAEKSLKQIVNKKFKDDKDRKKTVTHAHEIEICFPTAPYTSNGDGNVIGEAGLGLDQYNRADSPFAKEGATYENGIYKRGEIQVDTQNGDYKFAKGATVQDIINQVILSSDYGRKALTNPGPKVTWWRVETHFHQTSSEDPKTGEKAKKVIFRVVPYLIDAAHFYPPNTTSAPPAVVREYNWLYTGENYDILDWNIDYNIGFYRQFNADGGSNSDDKNLAARSSNAAPTHSGGTPPEPEPSGTVGPEVARRDKTGSRTTLFGGASFDDAATLAARQFMDIVNHDQGLLNVDLTILGDPYYLGDSGHGNFTIPGNGPENSEGSVNWQEGQTYIKLAFRMPEDINTDTGYYEFGGMGKPVREFSGYYMIQQVDSTFSRGSFKQKLQLTKQPGIVDPGPGTFPPPEPYPSDPGIYYP